MIAPTAFGFNDQTAQDNSFMHASREGGSTEAGSDVTHQVLREFSGLYRELTEVQLCSIPMCPLLQRLCVLARTSSLPPHFDTEAALLSQCNLVPSHFVLAIRTYQASPYQGLTARYCQARAAKPSQNITQKLTCQHLKLLSWKSLRCAMWHAECRCPSQSLPTQLVAWHARCCLPQQLVQHASLL